MLHQLYTIIYRVLLFLALVVVECEFNFRKIPMAEGRILLVELGAL